MQDVLLIVTDSDVGWKRFFKEVCHDELVQRRLCSVAILLANIVGKYSFLVSSTAHSTTLPFKNIASSCRGYSVKIRFLCIPQGL
jgi:hypothetical protein